MKKSFLIVRSNIRKSVGQTTAIVVLVLLSALMLNLWLMLATDYTANFDRYHNKLNAEHVTLVADENKDEFKKFLSKTVENDSRTSEYRLDNCMCAESTFCYNDDEIFTDNSIFLEKQAAVTRTVGKIEILEEGNETSGVYLPLVFKNTDGVEVGEQIDIIIGNHKMTYTICGFFNSIMMGSSNCGMIEVVLTEDKYTQLEDMGYAPQSTLCSVRLKDKQDDISYETWLSSAVLEDYPNIGVFNNNYSTVAQARYISQMVCSGIISAMAFFVLLIALVVIVSNIINYIQVNMKNLGALKAVGYTSGQLICSLLLQFLTLTFIAALVGIVLSYCLFPAINTMMIQQTAIPYTMRFLPIPLLATLVVLAVAVTFAVWFASRKIKKIEPIDALRSGIQTHNFKRNHIPFEKTNAPLNLAFALKNTMSGVKYNITVFITMLVLSLVIVFSGLMIENVIADITPFLNLIVGENSDSSVNILTEKEDSFLHAMEDDSRVEKIYLYTTLDVSHNDGANLMASLCDDYSVLDNQNLIVDGRYPKYDNEIAVGAKYAGEEGLKVGDEIEIAANGKKFKYLICGFTQTSYNLGRDCMLTRKGYERLGELTILNYHINLTDKTDIDAFNQEVKDKFSDSVIAAINLKTTLENLANVYVSLMTVIVIAVLIISAVIIVFVLYLLVRTMLNNKLNDYGIMEALGFTSKQLILQTALSFMPTTILSVVVGLVISSFIINPLTALFLSGIGIIKCTFTIPILFIVIAGIGLVIFAFVIVCALSLKIKKIAPRAMLSGE